MSIYQLLPNELKPLVWKYFILGKLEVPIAGFHAIAIISKYIAKIGSRETRTYLEIVKLDLFNELPAIAPIIVDEDVKEDFLCDHRHVCVPFNRGGSGVFSMPTQKENSDAFLFLNLQMKDFHTAIPNLLKQIENHKSKNSEWIVWDRPCVTIVYEILDYNVFQLYDIVDYYEPKGYFTLSDVWEKITAFYSQKFTLYEIKELKSLLNFEFNRQIRNEILCELDSETDETYEHFDMSEILDFNVFEHYFKRQSQNYNKNLKDFPLHLFEEDMYRWEGIPNYELVDLQLNNMEYRSSDPLDQPIKGLDVIELNFWRI